MPLCSCVTLLRGVAQVMEISLQCTLFQRWDGIRIYYPNARLSGEPILNVSRSANRWEGFKVALLETRGGQERGFWRRKSLVEETGIRLVCGGGKFEVLSMQQSNKSEGPAQVSPLRGRVPGWQLSP